MITEKIIQEAIHSVQDGAKFNTRLQFDQEKDLFVVILEEVNEIQV